MRILALGDVVGQVTVNYMRKKLWEVRRRERIDFVVANGENATDIKGVCTQDAKDLLDSGVDVITMGNHTFGKRDIYAFLDGDTRVIRPANFPAEAPGNGYTVVTVDGWRVLCINVIGRVYMEPYASPFDTVDRILLREAGNYDFAVMDVHAEATSEKLALAHWFDGRVRVIFGTHTHVPTADEQILPKGSGYVTDLGMCGPTGGIIGTAKEPVIERFRTLMPTQFALAEGAVAAHGVIFDVGESRVERVRRIVF